MGAIESHHAYALQIRESANDGSDFGTPDADYRYLFLGEDGLLHVKDAANAVTGPYSSGTPDLSTLTLEQVLRAVSDYVGGYSAADAATRGFPLWALPMSRQHTIRYSEMMCPGIANAVAVDGLFLSINSGSGGTPTQDAADAANHPGIITLSTGTSSTGRSGFNALGAENVVLGSGKVRVMFVLKIPTLSDGTNTFTVWGGLSDSLAGNPTDGVFFRYTNGTNSGKWEIVARQNGSESAADSTVTADTSWHCYEIEVNAAASSVEYFIDGVSKGTRTTQIPTGTARATNYAPPYIVKSLGGTARTISIDCYMCAQEWTSSR